MFKFLFVIIAGLFSVSMALPSPYPAPTPAPKPVARPEPVPQFYAPYAYSGGYYAAPYAYYG